MSDSFWASSSVSGDNQGGDLNSSDKQIHIYVDEQLRQSFSVSRTLSKLKQKGQIYGTLVGVLFDDNGHSDIILSSVRITTTPQAKPVATDELQQYARDNDLFTYSVSRLLAMNTESEISLWFLTPAGQARAAQDVLHPAKRMKNSHQEEAVPLDQQFVHELVTKIAERFFCPDLIHSQICVQLFTCIFTYILWPNAQYCEIAKKVLTSYRTNWKKRFMNKNGNNTTHSTSGSTESKDRQHHNAQACYLVKQTLLKLAAEITKLDAKDKINDFTDIATSVYFMLYTNRDDATRPDLPSHLKCKLLLDM